MYHVQQHLIALSKGDAAVREYAGQPLPSKGDEGS